MAYISRIKIWIPGEILYASDLNAEFDNLCNNVLPAPADPAQGDLFYFNGVVWTRFPAGVLGKFLRTQGALANPKWDNLIQSDFASVLHAWMQDLSADNHPQYLNLDKVGQTLLKNLAVGAGITIDNRDLSVDGAKLDALNAQVSGFGFGAPVAKSIETVYQATTDGILVACAYEPGNGYGVLMKVLSDSSNPPTTLRAACKSEYGGQNYIIYSSVTVPILKTDYYKVTKEAFGMSMGGNEVFTIYFYPLGFIP